MAYTAIDDAGIFFNTKLYTGTGASNALTGVGFQPDFTWIKNRDAADFHVLTDAVRGATKYIMSDVTDAETTNAESLKSFDSDGFTVGTMNEVNTNTEAFVAWCWKANGAGSSNTDGSITSTVSANTTAGFSIVKWTGDDSTATIGHGLGAVPKMIITKRYDYEGNWFTYHHSLGNTKYILLEATDAEATSSNAWDDTSPTSSVFTKASANNIDTGTYIAYCFAEKQGFSKFGTYTGNGDADGPFVYTGFRPAYVMSKKTTSDPWRIMDTTRSTYNVAQNRLRADSSDAEVTASSQDKDFLSNGFKIRNTDGGYNGSGSTYLYMAFAEASFVNSNGVPCNAR